MFSLKIQLTYCIHWLAGRCLKIPMNASCVCVGKQATPPLCLVSLFKNKHLPDSVKRKKAMSRILWIGKINLKKNSKRPLFNPRPPPTFWQFHCNVICQAWRIIALSKMNQRKMKAFLRDKIEPSVYILSQFFTQCLAMFCFWPLRQHIGGHA